MAPRRGGRGPQPVAQSAGHALGLATPRVEDVASRAKALLWPEVDRTRGVGEALLPGITSPADVHLCPQRRRGGAGPLARRLRAGGGRPRSGRCARGLAGDRPRRGRRTPERLNEEIGFLRSVFGLVPSATEELETQGRLRSRALRPPRGAARLVVNVREEGAGESARSAGVNQVAFACEDLLAQVRLLRARGVELMRVPDNYYVDLAGRFPLPDEQVQELREHQVLYDRVGDGELLHVYTDVLSTGFYVELLGDVVGTTATAAPTPRSTGALRRDHLIRSAVTPICQSVRHAGRDDVAGDGARPRRTASRGVGEGGRRRAVLLAVLRRADGLRQPRDAHPARVGRGMDAARAPRDHGRRTPAARPGPAREVPGHRDLLSGGRLTVGVGVGGREEDYRAVDVDLAAQTMGEMARRVAVMRQVWAGEKVSEAVRPVGPPPVQPGGPPVLVGTMGHKTVRHAASWADGIAGVTLDLDLAAVEELFDLGARVMVRRRQGHAMARDLVLLRAR